MSSSWASLTLYYSFKINGNQCPNKLVFYQESPCWSICYFSIEESGGKEMPYN